MAGTPRPRRDRKAMGLWLDQAHHDEAERIADAAGLHKSQVIRLAIEAGLPIVAQRFAPEPPRFDPSGGEGE